MVTRIRGKPMPTRICEDLPRSPRCVDPRRCISCPRFPLCFGGASHCRNVSPQVVGASLASWVRPLDESPDPHVGPLERDFTVQLIS